LTDREKPQPGKTEASVPMTETCKKTSQRKSCRQGDPTIFNFKKEGVVRTTRKGDHKAHKKKKIIEQIIGSRKTWAQ